MIAGEIIIKPEDIANAPRELGACDTIGIGDNILKVISSCGFEGFIKYVNFILLFLALPLLIILPIAIIYLVYSLVSKKSRRILKIVLIAVFTFLLGYIINIFIVPTLH